MMMNKAQGQLLKVAGIKLHNGAFSHDQLYVGCSRFGKPENQMNRENFSYILHTDLLVYGECLCQENHLNQ